MHELTFVFSVNLFCVNFIISPAKFRRVVGNFPYDSSKTFTGVLCTFSATFI